MVDDLAATIASVPGWSWRRLGLAEIDEAYPLVLATGERISLAEWRSGSAGWAAARREERGLIVLATERRVFVALARYLVQASWALPRCVVGELRVLDLGVRRRMVLAAFEAVEALALQLGCARLTITPSWCGPDDGLVHELAARLRFDHSPRGLSKRLADGPAATDHREWAAGASEHPDPAPGRAPPRAD